MDDFVRNKLIEWQLNELEERFEANKITEESLFCLTENDITELIRLVGPRARFRCRLEQLKNEQNKRQETPELSAQASLPRSSKGKRQSDLHGESSERQPPTKRQRDSAKETRILSEVKDIMKEVKDHINDKEQLGAFIKNKISDLETDKRELVGVFGRTGAGKSSLINAIINEMNLLPTGTISACTTVMIKVEANTSSSKYEAQIEFIKKEEWEDELWSLKTLKEADDDYWDLDEKLSALYGEERKDKSPETLMEPKYFKNIPEFLESTKKSLECETAQELFQRLRMYTKQEDGKSAQQWFWPLVKCVTVRVPNNDLLQHVTLVDLPGNGDRNKSRNEMWKQIVGDCSTVWIVAEITRAASETEAWEILKSGLIGNGGQCQQIHFICTKSDPADDRVTKNKKAKEKVMKEFHTLNKTLSEQFSGKDFEVFTVSAQEVLKRKRVKEDDNEIPKLQDILQNLNECHSETDIYVNGAYGILSLIEGARGRNEGVGKADGVCKVLEKNMTEQLDQVKKAVEKAIKDFEQCLTEGVKNSQTSEEKLKTFLDCDENTIVFKQLQAVVRKNGIHKPKYGEEINLNTMLASCLTDSIDKNFRKTFPNDVKGRYFDGVISRFSLDTKPLIPENLDVKLQLIFLQTEEERIKAKLNKIILKKKKIIYNSLTETIVKSMQKGYDDAKKISGKDALENMRNTLETHVSSNRNMYEDAKKTMLEKMDKLKTTICKELKETMEHSIKLSFKADVCPLPDVSKHLKTVQRYHDEV
ncbi:nuclear GTPase SLIP-GC-like [Oreochromis niloticus]|uniref:nuclear GTPase SLIP-GC-like n=1 Tax=Oreochromis niloticus TaxID=8128 RepID=UPI0009055CC8|nr:nuclear GTPase SLIP-GC-like [Oreochromis niloticus]